MSNDHDLKTPVLHGVHVVTSHTETGRQAMQAAGNALFGAAVAVAPVAAPVLLVAGAIGLLGYGLWSLFDE